MQYAKLGYDIVGGSNGMVLGFAEMIRFLTKQERPTLAIVVSDESKDYWDEMMWFESALRDVSLDVFTVKPHDVLFAEDGLYLESTHGKVQIDVLYRFFELFRPQEHPESGVDALQRKEKNGCHDASAESLP